MEQQEKMIELLEDIKKTNRKNILFQGISMALIAIFVAAVLCILPLVISTLNTAQTTLTHLNEAITTMEDTMVDIQDLADNGGTAIEDAMTKIEAVDFENLNEAITDLSNVVEPMADFFGMFGH